MRLQPLGVGQADRQAARDIERHVMAADGERIDMGEAVVGEGGDGRRPGAEIDQSGAKFGLVVNQRRQARRIGRGDDGGDPQMTALNRQHEIARRRNVAGRDAHFGAERLADHAARVGDAALRVERKTLGDEMQRGAAGAGAGLRGGFEHLGRFGVADRRALHADARG